MQLTCPACGKLTDLGTTPSCPRCSCDLAPLAACLQAAHWHLGVAKAELKSGHWPAAAEQAEESWRLRHSAAAARIGCLAAVALADTPAALRWFRRAANSANAGIEDS
jgi:hypothetical protein